MTIPTRVDILVASRGTGVKSGEKLETLKNKKRGMTANQIFQSPLQSNTGKRMGQCQYYSSGH